MSEQNAPFVTLGRHLKYVREQLQQSLAEVSGAVQTAYFSSIRDHASRVGRHPLRKPLRRDLLDSAQILLEGYRPQVEAYRQPGKRWPHVDAVAERRLEHTLKCHAISHPI